MYPEVQLPLSKYNMKTAYYDYIKNSVFIPSEEQSLTSHQRVSEIFPTLGYVSFLEEKKLSF